jgi:hypothetical protein
MSLASKCLAQQGMRAGGGHGVAGEETRVRKLMVGVVAAAIGFAGCDSGGTAANEAMTADLERDLELATAPRLQRTAVVSAIESGPTGAPSGTARGQRAPVAVKKRAPRPAPVPAVEEVAAPETAADLPAPMPNVAVSETVAPTPALVIEPPSAPATDEGMGSTDGSGPSVGASGEGDRGRSGSGRRGGGIGGVIGVIIRGGHAGVDKCEEHDRQRRGRGAGGIGTIGGIGGGIRIGGVRIPVGGDTRAPVGRPTYPRY